MILRHFESHSHPVCQNATENQTHSEVASALSHEHAAAQLMSQLRILQTIMELSEGADQRFRTMMADLAT